ncbi:phosphodiester glycosidase family protein [Bacillus litorisediminis]|uniref:phosphodiester glycosidase family protein n=1 Tax=Bacillus litorisediminis TaxID=2922713 RepID=UPI001FABD54E|nr:phosphodiester glycosidase family protein [Bacillus litorisediminis]
MRKTQILVIMLLSVLLMVFPLSTAAGAQSLQLSPGVKHTQEKKVLSGNEQFFNVLEVDLTNPYTQIEVGVPNPLNSLKTVTSLAKRDTQIQHHVVGAVNASFFHTDTRLPAYLLAVDNEIVNLGAVSSSYTDYMYKPAAFGINQDGIAQISTYNLNIQISHHGKTFPITGLNRERNTNESILFTKAYSYDHTRTNPYGLEIVVRNLEQSIDHNLPFGKSVKGKVTSIRPYGQYTSASIPEDGYVISAQGTAVDAIRDLAIGDEISISIDVEDKWKNSDFMLASGPLLVQNGQVNMTIDPTSPRVTQRNPHTAVAVSNNGQKVFLVTVDGRQSGHSVGMTLTEFAQYLVSLGAEYALNLDGGGSTAMVTRKYGQTYPTLVNRPSDGRERSVSAILEAISTAPYGQAHTIKASQAQPGLLAVGASVGINIDYMLDQYFNNLTTYNLADVKYTVSNGIGHMEGNTFIADKPGKGTVTVSYQNGTASVPVEVVAEVGTLGVNPNQITIGTGQTQSLKATATTSTNQPLIFNDESVKWSVQGNVGTIDQSGTFTASTTAGTGSITATYGSKTITIPVKVVNGSIQPHDFESVTGITADKIRATASVSTEQNLTAKVGAKAIRLDYDFRNTGADTSAAYLNLTNSLQISGQPSYVGVWVYGDGKNHWLRGLVTDAEGKEYRLDFTQDNGLNWYGWKFVTAPIPSAIQGPIQVKQLYVAETSHAEKNKGSIYFDGLQVFKTAGQVEYFKPSSDAKAVAANKDWTVQFNTAMNTKTLNKATVYVQDQYGNRANVTVQPQADGKSVKVLAPSGGYTSGKTYQLVVTKYTLSSKGIPMKNEYTMQFKIN